MLKKLTFTLVLALLVAFVYAGNYLSNVMSAGSGFAAKNICSGYFLSGMPGQKVVAEILYPASPILANVSFEIDTVTGQGGYASFLGCFNRRASLYRGHGLYPVARRPGETCSAKLEVAAISKPDATLPWPQRVGSQPRTNIRLEACSGTGFCRNRSTLCTQYQGHRGYS